MNIVKRKLQLKMGGEIMPAHASPVNEPASLALKEL